MLPRLSFFLRVSIAIILVKLALFATPYDDSRLRQLAQEGKWLQLLYFYNGKSEIRDPSFFLAKDGMVDPYHELKSTLQAYFEPFSKYENPNDHPICRFPARYYWLHKTLHLPHYSIVNPHCTYLRQSLQKTPVRSVSLIFVTGYLGNPASSFGHLFIKLNTGENMKSDLFDLAISYGADVPKNENIFLYIYRGLFGRYDARFTDKYFYANDLVYTSLEQRDMWEYRLKMTKEQILYFRLHLWELLHKKFQYFFLNQNCGYEVARALEIALGRSLHVSNRLWYLPVEAVFALEEEGAVEKVVYHASAKKVLYQKYRFLSQKQRQILFAIVAQNYNLDLLDHCSVHDKSEILNFLLSYYDYLWLKNAGSKRVKFLKYQAMKKRILLPPSSEKSFTFAEKPPHLLDKPSLLGLAYGNNLSQKNGYFYLFYSPYSWKMDNDILEIFYAALAKDKKHAFVREFRLINIEKFSKYDIPSLLDKSFSWRIAAGYQSKVYYTNDYYMDLALGKSYDVTTHSTLALMGNISFHTDKQNVLLSPEMQWILSWSDVQARMKLNRQFEPKTKKHFNQVTFDITYRLKRNLALRFDFEEIKNRSVVSGGLQIHF